MAELQGTIVIDDKYVTTTLANRLYDKFYPEIRKEIFRIAAFNTYDTYGFKPWAEDLIKECILEYKDEIIDKAAKLLADSMRRSAKVREKYHEYLEEDMK